MKGSKLTSIFQICESVENSKRSTKDVRGVGGVEYCSLLKRNSKKNSKSEESTIGFREEAQAKRCPVVL